MNFLYVVSTSLLSTDLSQRVITGNWNRLGSFKRKDSLQSLVEYPPLIMKKYTLIAADSIQLMILRGVR